MKAYKGFNKDIMTIDEAIKHCLEVAENNEQFVSGKWIGSEGEANRQECEQCAADHRQLAEWLTELKELREIFSKVDIGAAKPKDYLDLLDEWAKARKLLKAAVEGFEFLGAWMNEQGDCTLDCSDCPLHRPGYYCRGWNKQDEALTLIGEDTDVSASANDTNVGHKSGGWISCKDRLPEPPKDGEDNE